MRAFGKYRLIEPIASGGMAEVWRAEIPGAEGFVKQVALKLIRGDHDAHGEFVSMFIREARLASRLAHGNIVQVFDFDQVDGRYYIAMELVRGRTLRQVVDRCREQGLRFGLARAVHVCAEIARALAYAHRVDDGALPGGVVHRDVSPQNVLLSFEGEVKLTDFGIARALHSADVTSPGTLKGKLAYMAPEQARGLPVDARADVFSVGVILWELCAGRRLFARDSDAAMLAAVMAPEPVSPPSAWNEAVPPELDAVVLGALAREAARRTATAEVLAASLASLRLRLATSHEDLDLRAMLCRLWPGGGVSSEAHGMERTVLRAVAEPEVERERAERALEAPPREPEPLQASRPARPAPADADEAPTRTALGTPTGATPRPRLRTVAFATVLVLVALGWGWRDARSWATAIAARAAPSSRRLPSDVSGEPVRSRTAEPAVTPRDVAPGPGARAGPEGGAPMQGSVAGSATSVPRAASSHASSSTPAPRPPAPVAESSGEPRQPAGAPAPASAALEQGRIVVRVAPWAYVTIDGEDAGDTPVDTSATATEHHLHAHHPSLGDDDLVVKLAPGERFVWHPRLTR